MLASVAAQDDGAPARVDRQRVDDSEAALFGKRPRAGGKTRPASERGGDSDQSDHHEKREENARKAADIHENAPDAGERFRQDYAKPA